MSFDIFWLIVAGLLTAHTFLMKIGNARVTEAEARKTTAEARLLEAQNHASQLAEDEA